MKKNLAMLMALSMMDIGLDSGISFSNHSKQINTAPPTDAQRKLLQSKEKMSKKRKAILKKQNK